jgi:hypothetical protein
MTTPTIFSDVATNPLVYRSQPQGVLAQRFVLTVPVGAAIGTNFGLIRFDRGFSLLSLALVSTDMDTATTLTLNVGYLYDGTTGEVNNAFFNASALGQSATSIVWPIATGLLTGTSFVATGPGYLSITTAGEPIEVAGTITGIATFTYNL